MNHNVSFEASLSGDGECFVFIVDRDTFKFIKGQAPDGFDENSFYEGKYNIYPDDVFRYLDVKRDFPMLVKIGIEQDPQ